jgi:hypothetical protein
MCSIAFQRLNALIFSLQKLLHDAFWMHQYIRWACSKKQLTTIVLKYVANIQWIFRIPTKLALKWQNLKSSFFYCDDLAILASSPKLALPRLPRKPTEIVWLATTHAPFGPPTSWPLAQVAPLQWPLKKVHLLNSHQGSPGPPWWELNECIFFKWPL